ARLFRHALWGPDRLVDDVDAGVRDSRQRQQVVAHVSHDVRGHRAAERGQRHLHVDPLGLDRDVVDESEVDDVDRDLGVEALAQHLDHVLRLHSRVGRDLGRDGGLLRHGFSSGRPASFHALVPPRKLTTSLTPSATAISDATAERSPAWQTKTVLSWNFWAVGLARMEFSTTCLAPGTCPLFHSQSSRTSTTSRPPASTNCLISSTLRSRKGASCCVIPIYYSSSRSANPYAPTFKTLSDSRAHLLRAAA